jgi:hypothetical protein
MSVGFASLAALLAVTGALGWSLASQQISSTSAQERALAVTQRYQAIPTRCGWGRCCRKLGGVRLHLSQRSYG